MSYITLKCKNCGASMSLNTESQSATCNHCGSTFLIADLLDEKDAVFVSKLSTKEIEQKMIANDALKKGETCLAKCDFEGAESYFKKAIENDESNFRCYLGVVKAKTENLNKLPENDDYLQFAHYALNLATGDDLILVKSELSKIDLLVREKRRQKRIFSSNQKREENLRKHRKEVSKLFSMIAIFIVLMFCGFIFISSMFTEIIFGAPDSPPTISVNSYEALSSVLSNKKYLGYTISLTSDIDCKGNSLTPFGTNQEPFTGTFNGNKHKISNAKIENTDSNTIGLFGCTRLANINNIILDNIDIDMSSTQNSENVTLYGLIAGKTESTTLLNIEIKNTCDIVVAKDYKYVVCIGGVAGAIMHSSFVSNISSHANISVTLTQTEKTEDSYIGGIIGNSNQSVIQNTCSNSVIIASNTNNLSKNSYTHVGGIVGSITHPTSTDIKNFNHNYFSGKIDLTTSNTITHYISSVAGSTLKLNQQLNNACLFTTTNFKHNSYNIALTKLYDYTEQKYFVFFYTSNDQYLSKLAETFKGWKNTNTFEPTLV